MTHQFSVEYHLLPPYIGMVVVSVDTKKMTNQQSQGNYLVMGGTVIIVVVVTLFCAHQWQRTDTLVHTLVRAFVSTLVFIASMMFIVWRHADGTLAIASPARIFAFTTMPLFGHDSDDIPPLAEPTLKIMIIDVHHDCEPLLRIDGLLGDVIMAARHAFSVKDKAERTPIDKAMSESMKTYAEDYEDADCLMFMGDYRRCVAAARIAIDKMPIDDGPWYGYIQPEPDRSTSRLRTSSVK